MTSSTFDAEALATALDGHPDYRVLRRLLPPMPTVPFAQAKMPIRKACALDVETTGLVTDQCKIIELGMQPFEFDADGHLVSVGNPFSWLEDPGEPLDDTIIALTGLTDSDLFGRAIDDACAAETLASADVVICHNAAFDRPFVEQRLPAAAGLPWACTMRDMDWRAFGFEGRSLSQLLWQCGYFHEAHRAPDDVTALIALASHKLANGRTVLAEVVGRAERPGWIIDAVGAPYEAKDALKARGYRWNATSRHWSREVAGEERSSEVAWLGCHVYSEWGGPELRHVDWTERHRG